MSDALLDRLARACGIQPSYQDIWEHTHIVADETKRALLAAMGIKADSESEIRAALDARTERSWRRVLPPVCVAWEHDGPPAIAVTVDESQADQAHGWRLIEESGEPWEGTTTPQDLIELERCTVDERQLARFEFRLPNEPPAGYHRFEWSTPDGKVASLSLILAPRTCYTPPALSDEGGVWGPAVQLYALRSARNWGIGDLTDLRLLVDCCAEMGADIAGVNPLHALFPHDARHCAPYGPSSRLFFNVLYLDVQAITEFHETELPEQLRGAESEQHRQALRESENVNYPEVSALKFSVLERLYQHFRETHLEPMTERGEAFRAFQRQGGEPLYRHSLFEALQQHFYEQDPDFWGWPTWPEAYRDPDAPEVGAFAEANRDRLEFFQYLQWQTEEQLRAVGQRALEHHLGIGLYQDLAVSVDRSGAEVWSNQQLYAINASIGSPPDDFNLKGQDWGLPPPIPDRLFESAYRPFIAVLRRNMRYTGALRIDHVMALMRLYWVPQNRLPTEGAYVHYPFEDLLAILALESQRNRCLVVGEDLGTVPDAVRAALAPLDILSYRLFYFQKDDEGSFIPPDDYPQQALVAVSTHDLPTLAGFWTGSDITLRNRLGLFPTPELREKQTEQRARDRVRILAALDHAGMLPSNIDLDPASTPEMVPALGRAIHRYLARTPARIMTIQLEDIIGQAEQVNLPGTTYEYPNWQRKLPILLEDLCYDPRLQSVAKAIAAERQPHLPKWPERPVTRDTAIPCATYRVQFNRDFTFSQGADLVPYLHDLGISHCYASPYLKARPGSPHGYDVIDHSSLNPEIGNEDDFNRFCEALEERGMSQILDIVPNHMGVMGSDNPWWLDVLENGPASVYANYFDIDWEPIKDELRGKVLIPVLGGAYGEVLESGELNLEFAPQTGSFRARYYEHLFPIDPHEYPCIFERNLEQLEFRLGPHAPLYSELKSIIAAFGHLPARRETDPALIEERNRDKEIQKRRLSELCDQSTSVAEFISECVNELNSRIGTHGLPLLHDLLERQAYRLAYWRVAADEINYRRFFDINELAGLRMEREQVFDATHRLVLDLIARGKVAGLRIDHPDGLYDPLQYYRRLHTRATAAAAEHPRDTRGPPPVYIVVEKILATYEHLREEWPVHGTSGYEFAVQLNGLFIDPDGEKTLDRLYARIAGQTRQFDELLYASKRLLMRVSLASELTVLANRLDRISELDPKTRDFTLTGLRDALMEVVACFPVYRTYVTDAGVSDEDRQYIEWAVKQAKRRSAAADVSVFDFVRDVLLLEAATGKSEEYRSRIVDFAMRFQQYTSPVTAKSLEDTALYRYNRLVSLNDVGGDPRRFNVSVSAFHHANQERIRRWPHGMLGSSTHDAKRSEDVRARINVLSEIADQWRVAVSRWRKINRSKKRLVDDQRAPDPNDEYLLYQTLIGAWPVEELDEAGWSTFRDRIVAYMLKATREAKTNTSWINQNQAYEEALVQFTQQLLDSGRRNLFLEDFVPFQRRVSRTGMFNSLAQLVLKLCSPGVPDIYQGNELWTFQLVDPDNRQPVDYEQRRARLAELKTLGRSADAASAGAAANLLDCMEDGRIKLYVTWRLLSLRREQPELFKRGTYLPLDIEGRASDHLCCFQRSYEQQSIIVVAPRLTARLTDLGERPPVGPLWDGTEVAIPSETTTTEYRDLFTGRRVHPQANGRFHAAGLLQDFPVAVLVQHDLGST